FVADVLGGHSGGEELGADLPHEGQRSAQVDLGVRGDLQPGEVHLPGQAAVSFLVPDDVLGVGQARDQGGGFLPQRVLGAGAVGVQGQDPPGGAGGGEVVEHADDGSAADSRGGEHERPVAVGEDDVSEGGGDG